MAHINLAQPRADDFFLSFLNFFIFTLLAFFWGKMFGYILKSL